MKQLTELQVRMYTLLGLLELNKTMFTEARITSTPRDIMEAGDQTLETIGKTIAETIGKKATIPTDTGFMTKEQRRAKNAGRAIEDTELVILRAKLDFINAIMDVRDEEETALEKYRRDKAARAKRKEELKLRDAALAARELQTATAEQVAKEREAIAKELAELGD